MDIDDRSSGKARRLRKLDGFSFNLASDNDAYFVYLSSVTEILDKIYPRLQVPALSASRIMP
tara:strand:- start:1578 stop:1763 length:186 start_codon:yes stop_codon:yes gene_type:complete